MSAHLTRSMPLTLLPATPQPLTVSIFFVVDTNTSLWARQPLPAPMPPLVWHILFDGDMLFDSS
jgi:hypothetical protein